MAKAKKTTAEPRPEGTETIEISIGEYEMLCAAKNAYQTIANLPVGSWIGRTWWWTKGTFNGTSVFPNCVSPEGAAVSEAVEDVTGLARAQCGIHLHGTGESDAEIGRSVRNMPSKYSVMAIGEGKERFFAVVGTTPAECGRGADPLEAFRDAGLWDKTPAAEEAEEKSGGNS